MVPPGRNAHADTLEAIQRALNANARSMPLRASVPQPQVEGRKNALAANRIGHDSLGAVVAGSMRGVVGSR